MYTYRDGSMNRGGRTLAYTHPPIHPSIHQSRIHTYLPCQEGVGRLPRQRQHRQVAPGGAHVERFVVRAGGAVYVPQGDVGVVALWV